MLRCSILTTLTFIVKVWLWWIVHGSDSDVINAPLRAFPRNVESYCIISGVSRILLLFDGVIRYLHWPHIEVFLHAWCELTFRVTRAENSTITHTRCWNKFWVLCSHFFSQGLGSESVHLYPFLTPVIQLSTDVSQVGFTLSILRILIRRTVLQ